MAVQRDWCRELRWLRELVMSEKGRWSLVNVLAGVAGVVGVVVVVAVGGLSRERDRARGVRCVIRRCWGGMVSGGIGEERKLVVAHGGSSLSFARGCLQETKATSVSMRRSSTLMPSHSACFIMCKHIVISPNHFCTHCTRLCQNSCSSGIGSRN